MHLLYSTFHLCCAPPSLACAASEARNENSCKRKKVGKLESEVSLLHHEEYDGDSEFSPSPSSKVYMTFILIGFNPCYTLIFISLHLHIIFSYIVAHTVCIVYSSHLLFFLFCPATGFMWFPRLCFLATLAICLLHVYNICCHPQAVPFREGLCYHPLPVSPQFHIIFWVSEVLHSTKNNI